MGFIHEKYSNNQGGLTDIWLSKNYSQGWKLID